MKYKINDIEYNVEINSYCGNKAEVTVNGVVYQVEIGSNETPVPEQVCGLVEETSAASVQDVFTPSANARTVCSPLPGVIIGVKVKIGDAVKAGQVLAVLEAMKMENEIQAEFDGTVTSVNVVQGDSILEGAPIVTIG